MCAWCKVDLGVEAPLARNRLETLGRGRLMIGVALGGLGVSCREGSGIGLRYLWCCAFS